MSSINVSGIAPTTTQESLHAFFTFCGRITKLELNDKAEPRSAVITFEKLSAAKTALMLDEGVLDGVKLSVSSDTVDIEADDLGHDVPFEQSDKPRAGIAAEYLAKGYKLSDNILQRAIEIDNKQGISKKFLDYWHTLDQKIGNRLGPDQTLSGRVTGAVAGATQQAKAMDEQRGISKAAGSYYERALGLPFGQKVFAFYTSTSKQVLDIHEEAKRIARHQGEAKETDEFPATELTEQAAPPTTATTTASGA